MIYFRNKIWGTKVELKNWERGPRGIFMARLMNVHTKGQYVVQRDWFKYNYRVATWL